MAARSIAGVGGRAGGVTYGIWRLGGPRSRSQEGKEREAVSIFAPVRHGRVGAIGTARGVPTNLGRGATVVLFRPWRGVFESHMSRLLFLSTEWPAAPSAAIPALLLLGMWGTHPPVVSLLRAAGASGRRGTRGRIRILSDEARETAKCRLGSHCLVHFSFVRGDHRVTVLSRLHILSISRFRGWVVLVRFFPEGQAKTPESASDCNCPRSYQREQYHYPNLGYISG
eukprot:CAMPEP_0114539196 /NCGR_PEP_ID=MMETSP0114-20121206/109_1 /TAXON_ID=31324 /ORGANISM="Goniomonas sp, Strain m" /LENGTH=226 /DNA_ID=CAMNT_0001723283 /DNA_START=325 /DNA_END=1006 /DNA_ORIENTATION=-